MNEMVTGLELPPAGAVVELPPAVVELPPAVVEEAGAAVDVEEDPDAGAAVVGLAEGDVLPQAAKARVTAASTPPTAGRR
ncbi:MAG: hypothetical protein ACRD0J_18770 [Acidimicrobiales bacterium]